MAAMCVDEKTGLIYGLSANGNIYRGNDLIWMSTRIPVPKHQTISMFMLDNGSKLGIFYEKLPYHDMDGPTTNELYIFNVVGDRTVLVHAERTHIARQVSDSAIVCVTLKSNQLKVLTWHQDEQVATYILIPRPPRSEVIYDQSHVYTPSVTPAIELGLFMVVADSNYLHEVTKDESGMFSVCKQVNKITTGFGHMGLYMGNNKFVFRSYYEIVFYDRNTGILTWKGASYSNFVTFPMNSVPVGNGLDIIRGKTGSVSPLTKIGISHVKKCAPKHKTGKVIHITPSTIYARKAAVSGKTTLEISKIESPRTIALGNIQMRFGLNKRRRICDIMSDGMIVSSSMPANVFGYVNGIKKYIELRKRNKRYTGVIRMTRNPPGTRKRQRVSPKTIEYVDPIDIQNVFKLNNTLFNVRHRYNFDMLQWILINQTKEIQTGTKTAADFPTPRLPPSIMNIISTYM